jgi:BirA family transcriptional regulator, biotin operon repressor / biotin---[acetyl-CoA-carboxylase] ligase
LENTAPQQLSGEWSPYPTAVPEVPRISDPPRWAVQRFAELYSTNRSALEQARAGAPDGLVVVADHQTAGRGRLDRIWEAPPGSSLLVSVLVRRAGGPEAPHGAVMAAAVALAEAVEAVAGITVGIKWPNDLVVGDRKLAGLLAERENDALVIGSGCNVNWASFPAGLAATATACNLEAGRAVDRDALLAAYLDRLATYLVMPGGPVGAYRERLVTVGRRVRVERTRGPALVGEATGVDADGVLLVRDDAGVEHAVTVGDVVHLRPA